MISKSIQLISICSTVNRELQGIGILEDLHPSSDPIDHQIKTLQRYTLSLSTKQKLLRKVPVITRANSIDPGPHGAAIKCSWTNELARQIDESSLNKVSEKIFQSIYLKSILNSSTCEYVTVKSI